METTTSPTKIRVRKSSQPAKGKPADTSQPKSPHKVPDSFEEVTAATFAQVAVQFKSLAETVGELMDRILAVEAKNEIRNRKDADLLKKLGTLEESLASGRAITMDDLKSVFEDLRDTITDGFATVAGATLMGEQKNLPGIVRELVAEGIGVKQQPLG